jgi:cytosine/adenosine deaminase-related metal-dependent hydrolase
MILRGARVALSATRAEQIDLVVARGRIRSFGGSGTPSYDLSGYLLLPGLINAHDHLEFALFPRLGSGPYPNAAVWAQDIYRPGDSPVREHLRIPKWVRLYWGGLRNLLAGVTFVAHHNPFDPATFRPEFPVRVLRRYGWAHSLDFSSDVSERFCRTPPRWPFIVHAAEGSDAHARSELRRLANGGALGNRTVIVHGVGASRMDIQTMRNRGAALVWCPSSNLFTLGRTVPPQHLHAGLPVALGTDSPLTAEGDLIDEIRVAQAYGACAPDELFEMITTGAARILRLGGGHGAITEGGVADLVAIVDRGQTPANAVLGLQPHMVMVRGRMRMISDSFARRLRPRAAQGLHPIEIEGRGRWLTDIDIPTLHSAAREVLGHPVRLAGRAVRA